MSADELAFVREALRACGRADAATIARFEAAWAAQEARPIRFLAALGAIDAATARALEAVHKGYLKVPAAGLLAGFTAPASLREIEPLPAPPPALEAPPDAEGSGVLGPIPEWNSIPEASAPTPRRERPSSSRTRATRSAGRVSRIDAPAPGERIAACTLRELLRAGPAAATYRAYHESLRRTVILKVLHRDLGARERERLADEARRLARVDHPHVLRLLEWGEHQGAPYLVLEDVYAIGLDEHLEAAGALAPEVLLRVALCAARGLEAALAAGVRHGDLSPRSLRLYGPDGRVKVADFGAAGEGESIREGGLSTLRGTPTTMAPERVVGGEIDHRADMYSLGATLFELATGRPPFVRATALETLRSHLHDPAPEVHDRVSGFPPALSQAIARLLRKRPRDRFAGWGEVIAALVGVRADLSSPIADAVHRAVHGDAALTSLFGRKLS